MKVKKLYSFLLILKKRLEKKLMILQLILFHNMYIIKSDYIQFNDI
jgi:hypothetical protein